MVDYDEYLGVGSGAFSFLNDSLYVNTFSLRRYNERIAAGNTGVERRRQFDKQSRTETDSQREQTRTCNRSRAKSGSHYADTDKQSRTETDSRCNGFPVVKNRLPCLPDFVQALTDSPNLHEKQPRCDTQLCENCSTESNVHDERCTDRTKQSSHNTDNR